MVIIQLIGIKTYITNQNIGTKNILLWKYIAIRKALYETNKKGMVRGFMGTLVWNNTGMKSIDINYFYILLGLHS